MSRYRSIRTRNSQRHHNAKEPNGDLNITSLLDVLTFLLISLLANYNYSGEVINIPPDITLPKSTSLSMQTSGVSIKISATKIWVEDELVVEYSNPSLTNRSNTNSDEKKSGPQIIYDEGGRRIVPLYDKLVSLKNQIDSINKQVTEAKKFSGKANLVVDQKMQYDDLKKVLYTCASAGFEEFKFLVMNKDF